MDMEFGSDNLTHRVVLELMIGWILLGVLSFLTINTILWEVAEVFWVFGLMGMSGVTVAFVIKGSGKSDIFDVSVAGQSPLGINKKVIFLVAGALFLVSFFLLANSEYIIAAPSFQIINLGINGEVLLTVAAAFMEDIFFFVLIPGIIFSLVFYFMKSIKFSDGAGFWLGIATVILLVPFIFMIYHVGVYGFENEAAMTFVWFFGLVNTILMILLRDIVIVHMWHFGNNLGILIFQGMSLDTFITTLSTSIWFWAIIIFIGVVVVLRLRKK